MKAGSTEENAVEVAATRSNDTDITSQLSGKKYVRIGSEIITVTLNVQGYGDNSTIRCFKGDKISNLPEPEEPDNISFSGWYKEPGCINKWDAANDTVNGDTTLYAGWVEREETAVNYLTFTAKADSNNSVTLNYKSGKNVKYRLDQGKWTSYAKGTTIGLNKGESVSFRGNDVTTGYNSGNPESHEGFVLTGRIAASGSVTSLTDACGSNPDVNLTEDCYRGMFYGCESLTSAPELPATKLAFDCYDSLFRNCDSLKKAPALPATTMTEFCYEYMFCGCTSLTVAPELPATKLADCCYEYMFYGCTNLTVAPELPATTLAGWCYEDMFCGCKNLQAAPELPATTLAKYCYDDMFCGCTGIGLSETKDATYRYAWSIPDNAKIGEDEEIDTTDENHEDYTMFYNTGGTFKGIPEIGKTYYQKAATVTFCTNGGSAVEPQIINSTDEAQKVTKPDNPTREGYTFTGWYTDRECKTAWNFNENITACTTLYAGWEEAKTVPEKKPTVRNAVLPLQKKQRIDIASNIRMLSGDTITDVSVNRASIVAASGQYITGRSTGTATVRVSFVSGNKLTFKVKVQKGKVRSGIKIGCSTKLQMKKGQKTAIGATKTVVSCKDKIRYSSSRSKVASVSKKGIIKAKKKGTAKITVKCGSKKKKITVKVK